MIFITLRALVDRDQVQIDAETANFGKEKLHIQNNRQTPQLTPQQTRNADREQEKCLPTKGVLLIPPLNEAPLLAVVFLQVGIL